MSRVWPRSMEFGAGGLLRQGGMEWSVSGVDKVWMEPESAS